MTRMIKVTIALDGGNQHRILLPQVLFQAFQPLLDGLPGAGHQGFLCISSGIVPGVVSFGNTRNIPVSNKLIAQTPGTQGLDLFSFKYFFASLR
jgi:hypothetical protein